MLLRSTLLALVALLVLPAAAVAGKSSQEGECQAADAALAQNQLSKAREGYLAVLAADPSSTCAIRGLKVVAVAIRSQERTPAQDKTKEEVKEWAELIPQVLLAVGAVLAAGLLLLALALLFWTAATRLIKPSLRIKPFLDEGVEPKVGATMAAMVESRLFELSGGQGNPNTRYHLDLVVADVELFAADDDLSSAMGAFAEVPQLTLVVALLSTIERIFGRRAYVASGDLAPAGKAGAGVALAVHRRNRLQARETLWAPPRPPAPVGEEEESVPDDFYDLVVPTAAWLQYEVAAGLDSDVRLLTENADSWSRLGVALDLQRRGHALEAAEAYADAINLDPDNVGALVNLSLLLARDFGRYDWAIVLLLHARNVLSRRESARGSA